MSNFEVRKLEGNCEFEGCEKEAEQIVHDRKKNLVKVYCEKHAGKIVDQDSPEYVVYCPNCSCCFGVN